MSVLGFPNPVNEKAARVVAAGVVVITIVALATQWHWLAIVLAVGFLARVLTGPKLSLLGRLATQVIAPRLGAPRLVAGPPKRFAQGIGLAVTAFASLAGVALGWTVAANVALVVLLVFATLESVVGFCAGCWIFGRLIGLGVIPETVCVECATWTPGARRAHTAS